MPQDRVQKPKTLSILHEASSEFYFRGTGRLSLKTFTNGRAMYEAGKGHYAVEDGNYLLLNQDQEYSITIESKEPVESFCVFFTEIGMEDLKSSLTLSSEKMLDDPFSLVPGNTHFVEKTYTNKRVSLLLERLKHSYGNFGHDSAWMEERMYELGAELLRAHQEVCIEMQKLPSVKSSTKAELYKRVQIGHEYLSAYFSEQVTITDAAKVACMSTNHFLRSYKQLFGRSPHQYVTERRLQEAKKMLSNSDLTVTQICMEVGFQSPSSFSLLFSKRFGESPVRWREKVIFDKRE